MTGNENPYREKFKQLAKEQGVDVKDFLALTPHYDPFYIGNEPEHNKARWAKELFDWVMTKWEERKEQLSDMGIEVGSMPHLRAIHYLLFTGHPDPIRWDGKRYTGTHGEWKILQECFKNAKLLGYIPFGIIEDHKHPNVIENLWRQADELITEPDEETVEMTVTSDDILIEFSVEDEIRNQLEIEFESVIDEIRYDVQRRIPVHIELWTEKQRELVDTIAQDLWVNVQNAVGQQTYENIYSLLKRAVENSEGKPVRILYMSDFDPRGLMTMPVGVSRIIEWMLARLDEFDGMDIKLKRLLLTQEQIQKYELPPSPVKQTESMAQRWRDHIGEGICEIDSIETLFAPEMVTIIRDELSRYIPKDIVKMIRKATRTLDDAVRTYNNVLDNKISSALESSSEMVQEKLQEVLSDLSEDIEVDMSVEWADIKELLDDFKEPDWDVDDGDEDWMFDSENDYPTQLQKYKEIRGD